MVAIVSVAASLLFAALGGWSTSQRPALISGVITDTTGRGLPGARITVISEDGERQTTVTDSAGRYRIDELRPGRYALQASMVGFDPRTTSMKVPSGSDAVWSGALLIAPPLGEMSIERQVMQFTGSDALDCGRYSAPASESALQRSLTCALTSAGARRSFSVVVQFAAGGTLGGEGLLAGPDGVVHLLQYGKGQMSFRLKPCASPQVTNMHFTCQP